MEILKIHYTVSYYYANYHQSKMAVYEAKSDLIDDFQRRLLTNPKKTLKEIVFFDTDYPLVSLDAMERNPKAS